MSLVIATPPIALTIAGSDSSGGAGIQADLKTFAAFGVYGASVVTAITAQNTCGVTAVEAVSNAMIGQQIAAVTSDLAVGAAKTGMLGTRAIVEAVLAALADRPNLPLVVDPVMVATSGDILLADDAIAVIRARLLPRATIVTPNIPEAARLLGVAEARDEDAMIAQARAIAALGVSAVLIKGGHGQGSDAVDILLTPAGVTRLAAPRVATRHSHGTGCTLSAAIAALLAGGTPLPEAVSRAKTYVGRALDAGRDHVIGRGRGPVDHQFHTRRGGPPA